MDCGLDRIFKAKEILQENVDDIPSETLIWGVEYLTQFFSMNIFVSDPDPVVSAQVLPDKHIVKMPLETCQMLAIVASDKWGHGYGSLPQN